MGDPRGRIKAARKEQMEAGSAPSKEKGKEKKKGPAPGGPAKKLVPRSIIRVAGTDLDGNKAAGIALMKIRGVGYNFARAVLHVAGIDWNTKLAQVSEEQMARIEGLILKPIDAGIPAWLVNRRNDPVTGQDLHVSGADLSASIRQDIEGLKRIRAYRGIRHEMGLPTRGQHTRTSGRKGGRVGVIRKKAMPGAAPAKPAAAAAPAKKEEKK